MKKQAMFKKLLKKHRKELLLNGFDPGTLSNWAAGRRIPSVKQRKKLSSVLLVDQAAIPRIERRVV